MSLVLGGCATPSVDYQVFTKSKPRESLESLSADSYMLSRSVVTITRVEEGESGDKERFTTVLKRLEHPDVSFAFSPTKKYGVSTNVVLTKTPNTQLIEKVTVELEDKRKEFIAEAFKVLGSVTQLVSAAPQANANRMPMTFDLSAAVAADPACSRSSKCLIKLSGSSDPVSVSVAVDELPPDAVSVESVLSSPELVNGSLIVSACRQVRMRVALLGPQDMVTSFSLADPRFVQLVAMPKKGTINAHSECGYSVVSDKVEEVTNLQVADSFLTELKKFLDSTKKDD
ncbi:MAG: hypothetical protein NVV67_05705 [Pseudoxanthomonas sp.]|nr:hypothetical protein [Pseudoxanthomonas sp.]